MKEDSRKFECLNYNGIHQLSCWRTCPADEEECKKNVNRIRSSTVSISNNVNYSINKRSIHSYIHPQLTSSSAVKVHIFVERIVLKLPMSMWLLASKVQTRQIIKLRISENVIDSGSMSASDFERCLLGFLQECQVLGTVHKPRRQGESSKVPNFKFFVWTKGFEEERTKEMTKV